MDADVYSTEIKSFTHNKTNHVIVSKNISTAEIISLSSMIFLPMAVPLKD